MMMTGKSTTVPFATYVELERAWGLISFIVWIAMHVYQNLSRCIYAEKSVLSLIVRFATRISSHQHLQLRPLNVGIWCTQHVLRTTLALTIHAQFAASHSGICRYTLRCLTLCWPKKEFQRNILDRLREYCAMTVRGEGLLPTIGVTTSVHIVVLTVPGFFEWIIVVQVVQPHRDQQGLVASAFTSLLRELMQHLLFWVEVLK